MQSVTVADTFGMRPRSTTARTALSAVVVACAVGLGTYALMRVVFSFFVMRSVASPLWWPVAALIVVVLVRTRRWWWPAAIAGFVAGSLLADASEKDWRLAATFMAASAIEAVVAATVLTSGRSGDQKLLYVLRDGIRFVVAGVVAVGVGTAVVTIVVVTFPTGPVTGHTIVLYVVNHLLGYLTVAPLLLSGRLVHRMTWASWAEFGVVATGAVTLSIWSLMVVGSDGRAFIMLIPVMWAAVRFDPLRATIVSGLTCALAAFATAHGRGPLAGSTSIAEQQLLTEIFILVATSATIGLVLLTRHRLLLAAQAKDSEQTMLVAIRDALIGMYSIRLEPGRSGEIRDVNKAMCDLLGYRREDLIGRHCRILAARDDADRMAVLRSHLDRFADGSLTTLREESTFFTKSGEPRWLEVNLSAVESVGEPRFVLVNVHDLTEREQSKRNLEKMALHDPLTGLANRTLLFRRINVELAARRPSGGLTGLLYLDLDGFKHVNDTYGHDAGDDVLIAAARRMIGAVRHDATVARLGGDEFAVLCPDIDRADELEAVAERLRRVLREPIRIGSGDVVVIIDVSIGAGTVSGEESADALIHVADQAMYAVKAQRPTQLR